MKETSSSESVSTKIERIASLAKTLKDAPLTTLAHHIDVDWLREAHRRTRKDGARGVDGQSAVQYGEQLETTSRRFSLAQSPERIAPRRCDARTSRREMGSKRAPLAFRPLRTTGPSHGRAIPLCTRPRRRTDSPARSAAFDSGAACISTRASRRSTRRSCASSTGTTRTSAFRRTSPRSGDLRTRLRRSGEHGSRAARKKGALSWSVMRALLQRYRLPTPRIAYRGVT